MKLRPDLSVEERKEFLNSVCNTSQMSDYQRELSDSEVEAEKHYYAQNGIELENAEQEFASVKEEFASKIKSLKTLQTERLQRIRTRQTKIFGKLWGIKNFQNQRMEFFDAYGDMINSRPLTPDEQNGEMFNNAGEPTQEVKEIGFEKTKPDIEDAEIIEENQHDSKTDTTESEDEPDEPQKPGKKPRNPKK